MKDRVSFSPAEISNLVLSTEIIEQLPSVFRIEALTPYPQRLNKLQEVFVEHADQPPGGDPYMSIAFKAILGNQKYLNFLLACQDRRRLMERTITYRHLANLGAVDAINYKVMFDKNSISDTPWDYPTDPALHLHTIEGWARFYDYMLNVHGDELEQLILERDIQTTHHTRSITWPTIAQLLPEDFTGEDWGSSIMAPWRFLAEGRSFTEKIIDHTEFNGQKEIFLTNAKTPVKIGHVEGIDLRNPLDNEDDCNWLLSCRHIDEVTTDKVEAAKKNLKKYQNGTDKVSFRAGNILDPEVVMQGGEVDIITLSTILYQFPHDIRKAVIRNALNKVHPEHGVVVINDYCKVEKINGDVPSIVFTEGRGEGSYGTVIIGPATYFNPMQIALYKTSGCTEIYPGPHTTQFIQLCEQSKNV